MQGNNDIWKLFEQAVLQKDRLQFNIYNLLKAVENNDLIEDEINQEEDILTM